MRAERAFNLRLQGGCQVPIAGFATLQQDALYIQGRVGSVDGQELLKAEIHGSAADAETLGRQLAEQLLAQGADRLLAALH